MRTLKFRQYYTGDDDSDPEWNYFDLRNGHMIIDGGYMDAQQFTGLTDKTGKEIYEGDIVNQTWAWDDGSDSGEGEYTGKVIILASKGVCLLNPTRFDLIAGTSRSTNSCPNVTQYRAEVIGNIYQDKHLLNNKSEL